MMLLILLSVMGTSTIVPPSVIMSTLTTLFLSGVVFLLLGVAAKQFRVGMGKSRYDLFLSHHKVRPKPELKLEFKSYP